MAEPVKVKVEDADSEVENHETEETEPEKEESDEKADTNKKPDSNEERSVALDLDQSSEHEEPAGAEPQEETLDEIKRDLKEEKEQVSTVIPEFGLKNWNSLVQMSWKVTGRCTLTFEQVEQGQMLGKVVVAAKQKKQKGLGKGRISEFKTTQKVCTKKTFFSRTLHQLKISAMKLPLIRTTQLNYRISTKVGEPCATKWNHLQK